MTLKGILIDFGDTLAYIDKENDRRYREEILSTIQTHGYKKPLNEIHSALNNAYENSSKGEVKNLEEFWRLFLGGLNINGKTEWAGELEKVRNRHTGVVFKLYEGAIRVLETLQPKYKLALVSNCVIGTADVIEELKLVGFFTSIVLSYRVGARKPERRIYDEALTRLALEPHECAFVADEISDLEGARDVGLRTLLVKQGSLTTYGAANPDFEPDFQCNSIAEVLSFFQSTLDLAQTPKF